uniref:Uncharacterized protein n=1 Tax=Parascaris equorum TaxID=6256 RepID=A0A914R716_PAREQ
MRHLKSLFSRGQSSTVVMKVTVPKSSVRQLASRNQNTNGTRAWYAA